MAEIAPVLENLRVASPCTESWDSMAGDARVRRCGACRRNVYNLSAMSRREAEDLVRRGEGRLCVRFFRRADGTVLTEDCPVGLRAVRRRLARAGAALAATFLALFAAGCGRTTAADGGVAPSGGGGAPGTLGRPVAPPPITGDVADPAPPQPSIMGEVCAPPPAGR